MAYQAGNVVGDIGASVATAVATAGVGGALGTAVRGARIAGEVKAGIQPLPTGLLGGVGGGGGGPAAKTPFFGLPLPAGVLAWVDEAGSRSPRIEAPAPADSRIEAPRTCRGVGPPLFRPARP